MNYRPNVVYHQRKFFTIYLFTKYLYRYQYRDILQISYRYRTNIQKVISTHLYHRLQQFAVHAGCIGSIKKIVSWGRVAMHLWWVKKSVHISPSYHHKWSVLFFQNCVTNIVCCSCVAPLHSLGTDIIKTREEIHERYSAAEWNTW